MSAAETRPAELFERSAHLRVAQQRRRPRDRRGVVGRKIVPVVLELHEIEAFNQAGCRVARRSRRPGFAASARYVSVRSITRGGTGKPQAVRLPPAREIRPAARETRSRIPLAIAAPRARASSIVFSPRLRASSPRTRIANVLLKPSGGSSVRPAARVVVADGRKHSRGSRRDRLMEDRRQRRARVFDVHVDVAREQRAIADQRAAEVQPPLDGQAVSRSIVCATQLAENQLLGEILRPDDDRVAGAIARARALATTDQQRQRRRPTATARAGRGGAAPSADARPRAAAPSTASASSAAGIAPARITVVSTIDSPR